MPAPADSPSPPPPPPLAHPLGPPRVDMRRGAEMQAWLAQLTREDVRLAGRNRTLGKALLGGVLMLATVLGGLYWSVVGEYAVLDEIAIVQHPASQGRIEVAVSVRRPGKVFLRRTSAGVQTDLVDTFAKPGRYTRTWNWAYTPGEPIDFSLWHRRGLGQREERRSFSTWNRADVVVLIDTTGSMTPFIGELQEKCAEFSSQLSRQSLAHRFALIGFGDAREPRWIDRHAFTDDVSRFRDDVQRVERFDGGDLPESALDALEQALALPLDGQAIHRFYLVTDAGYHEPAAGGATAEQLARRLADARVVLQVFSRPEYRPAYEKLLGDTGQFQEIENFGAALREGRILEDSAAGG